MRELDIGVPLAELDGFNDEADGHDDDDALAEMLGAVNLDDNEEDDDDDDNDDDDPGADAITETAQARQARARATYERLERARAEQATERALGFTQPMRRRVIEARRIGKHERWCSSAGAATIYDADKHADQLILAHTRADSLAQPPPTSLGQAAAVPKSLASIQFDRFVLHSTTIVEDTNSVATFYTGILPNLAEVAHRCGAISFNLFKFAADKMALEMGTMLLFVGSGVATGPKGAELSLIQCQEYVLLLNRLGIPATMQGYRLQNLVSKASAGWELDLNAIYLKFPLNAQYKPRFPGLIFRLDCGQLVAIFFKSGKVIITGSKSRAETRMIWTYLQNYVLRNFKMRPTDGHVTEAVYRRSVANESSIIEFTCSSLAEDLAIARAAAAIQQTSFEREAYDMLIDGDTKLEPPADVRAYRKRTFADALGDVLASDDDEENVSPIGNYLANDRIAATRWLSHRPTLIKR